MSIMSDEKNRVTPQESDEYDPKPESNTITPQESDEYDPPTKLGQSLPIDYKLDGFPAAVKREGPLIWIIRNDDPFLCGYLGIYTLTRP